MITEICLVSAGGMMTRLCAEEVVTSFGKTPRMWMLGGKFLHLEHTHTTPITKEQLEIYSCNFVHESASTEKNTCLIKSERDEIKPIRFHFTGWCSQRIFRLFQSYFILSRHGSDCSFAFSGRSFALTV